MLTGQTGLPPNQPTDLKMKNMHNLGIFQPIWLRKTIEFSIHRLSANFSLQIIPPTLAEHFLLFSFLFFPFLSFSFSPSLSLLHSPSKFRELAERFRELDRPSYLGGTFSTFSLFSFSLSPSLFPNWRNASANWRNTSANWRNASANWRKASAKLQISPNIIFKSPVKPQPISPNHSNFILAELRKRYSESSANIFREFGGTLPRKSEMIKYRI